MTTYSVNSLNQVTGDGMLNFGYDGNGNRSSQSSGGASVTYTYDDENQLVQAETDTLYTPAGSRWKTVWAYDARGRVRVREDYSWYGPGSYFIRDQSVRYLYDGMRVIQERNASNTPQVTYTRGLDLASSWERAGGIGGLLARTAHSGANGVTFTPAFYHADGNGNVTYLLKLDQTAGATYQFDPYGRLLASSGTIAAANTYRFSSKELMLGSGFYSFGYRFYDLATQRWLNRDPIGEDGGINLYKNVGNNPISNFDPLGLAFGDWWDLRTYWPGSAQLKGQEDIQAQLAAQGYGSIQQFQMDHPGYGGIMTSGNLDSIQAIATAAGEAADLYLAAATSVTPTGVGAKCGLKHFSGTTKPWRKGATQNSMYTHIDLKTGKAVQNAIYNDAGEVVGHVDFKNHGPAAPSGHGRIFPQPGNSASDHGPGMPHIPNNQLPSGWNTIPPRVSPYTQIGQ